MTRHIEILSQYLDHDSFCPLCKQVMYAVEASIMGRVSDYYQCSKCSHKIYPQQDHVCDCEPCVQQRKAILKADIASEHKKDKPKKSAMNIEKVKELADISFVDKLFLLALLENHVNDEQRYQEYFAWHHLKYQLIAPNYIFQRYLFKRFVDLKYVIARPNDEIQGSNNKIEEYYLNLAIDGYNEPSLFSVVQLLRQAFYQNLQMHVPFFSADEVKKTLYVMIYQEIVQYMQNICQAWHVQIAGNKKFEQLCYEMMEHLALSQLYALIYKALVYLHKQGDILQTRNDGFVNTNYLTKILQSYYKKITIEKWETANRLRPEQMPMSSMSYILFHQFLQFKDDFYLKPVWKLWSEIEPRLKFYATRHCIHCGSQDVSITYDDSTQVSLLCNRCQHQDFYFIQR
ncbi:MAG: hypothetical protein Q4D05_04760 [Acinetobacter sp.]|nr:hypothetical protein [Acinetobacter sp.]